MNIYQIIFNEKFIKSIIIILDFHHFLEAFYKY